MLKALFLRERTVLLVIILNAVVIFIQGFPESDPYSHTLELFDNIFTLYFLFEMITKLSVWGARSYFDSNWNKFDFVLVLLAMPALGAWIIGKEIIALDFLLIFRIMRVFKFFRFIRFVPKIDHIISGVGRASKASLVIIFAFLIFNFVVSLVSCFLFRHHAPEYFHDPLISFYSIFKIFTVEGWFEIPDAIAENASGGMIFFTRFYFIVVLFFGGIFGLSLVNSIFVDTMISDNNVPLEEKIEELEKKIDLLLEQKKS